MDQKLKVVAHYERLRRDPKTIVGASARTAEKFGVSDQSVREWAKKYGQQPGTPMPVLQSAPEPAPAQVEPEDRDQPQTGAVETTAPVCEDTAEQPGGEESDSSRTSGLIRRTGFSQVVAVMGALHRDLPFERAAELLALGAQVTRTGWPGRAVYVTALPSQGLHEPEPGEAAETMMGAGEILWLESILIPGWRTLWTPRLADLRARDWQLAWVE